MYNLETFYSCKDWLAFRNVVINERLNEDGLTICEYCGKPILKAYDIILHHRIFLTEENVNDTQISLNPSLIQLVHHKCHNLIHNKLGYIRKEIFLVYGSPLAGKTTWVKENAEPGDFIIDIDNIWECVSGLDRYNKPAKLNAIVFGVRDYLMDQLRIRNGKWNNAYIVGGYPLISERERICKQLGAREIYIESSREECLKRLNERGDRDISEWTKYIDDWWRKYRPPV